MSRANFRDSRLSTKTFPSISSQEGGSIEIFDTEAAASLPKAEVESGNSSSPNPLEYLTVKGNVLLRLSHSFTQQQVNQYVAALP